MSKKIASTSYDIYIENGLAALDQYIQKNNFSKLFFLVDSTTEELCLPIVLKNLPSVNTYDIIAIDPGEENKNIDFCIGIWKMLLDFEADRNSLILNVGGGVVTDMGSFAAATFKRGIAFVQVPTTLLAQVDASVGGKTGIDMDEVKNCIGTFTQPKAVVIDPIFLKTLSERQLVSGFAEMIKHGLIADALELAILKNTSTKNMSIDRIEQSIRIKNEIVKADPEEKGLRKILNFGHTIGHAIESYFLQSKSPLLHGEALAMGMYCETYLSQKHHSLTETEAGEIYQLLKTIFPLVAIPEAAVSDLLNFMKQDKKNLGDQIGFALLDNIGACSYNHYLSSEEITQSLHFYQKTII
jgi:3-dehydroquinate synthase